jgi:hypothetical protein
VLVRAYITISVGNRPDQARPVLASGDGAIVRAALRAIIARLGAPALLEGADLVEFSDPLVESDDRADRPGQR